MTYNAIETSPLDWAGDVLAIGLFADSFEEDATLSDDIIALDTKLAGTITELIEETKFKGAIGSAVITRVGGGSTIRKVALIGLGRAENGTLDTWRGAAAKAAKTAIGAKAKTLGLAFPSSEDATATTQAIVEGIELGTFQDNRFKSKSSDDADTDSKPQLDRIDLFAPIGDAAAIATAQQIASGVIYARELVAAPANTLDPVTFAESVSALAETYGLELTILEQEDCEKRGMGAFLGVARASDLPPKFVHLIYKPSGTPRKKLAIVGKGLTFDSGGLNIKVSGSGIETMKIDMGGAAATFGAAKAIAQLKPDVEVHFISAITENMISGKAMRPGDILTASNGKTIEVNNTDAEGRLTLADALVYADALGTDAIVDLATLTGACVVALGNDIAGLWSDTDELADGLLAAAKTAGEKYWRMPLEDSYFDAMKSTHADMKNTGSRAGGSITAALFLKKFVKDTPWAHLDIAAPVWSDKGSAYTPAGATGFGVRTLVNWVMS
ncbi:MAG: leucyl aminopeptidase [Coleofasciculaceae cyanobacterium RL_1_1]|nr:leucyl aminopeptidase [Coleofasciculaceae cyanobacterium RL_1_1]